MKAALQEKVYQLEIELEKKDKQINDLSAENFNLKQDKHKQSNEIRKLRSLKNVNMKKVKKAKTITLAQKKKIVHEVLKPFFFTNQIDCYLNQQLDPETGEMILFKRAKKWSNPEITLALTLKHLSPRTYRYLRKKKILPLPSERSIAEHFENFQIDEGYFEHVDELLKLMAKSTPNERDRVICLSNDEVHTVSTAGFDAKRDKIVGPHSNANVLIMRGLFKRFKIPLWTRFDSDLSKEELFMIIDRLTIAGYKVVSLTSDMGPLNMRLFGEKGLGLSIKKTFFKVPANAEHDLPERKIYYFFDVPHLLKLLRNHLLDSGFVLKSGTVITKADLQKLFDKLISTDGNEYTMAPKLNQYHLEVVGGDRQKVRLAAQLLSKTTSDMIKLLFKCDAKMMELSEFIAQINSWFDIFNSRKKIHKSNEFGDAYGVNKEKQDELLKNFYDTIKSLRVLEKGTNTPHKGLLPWQKGILIGINSLMPLFESLKQEFDITYLLTSRINQDALEQLFSILRAMCGRYTEFSALSFLRRLRDYILGAGKDLSIEAANVIQSELDDKEFCITNHITEDLGMKPTSLNVIKVKAKPAESEIKDLEDLDDNWIDLETNEVDEVDELLVQLETLEGKHEFVHDEVHNDCVLPDIEFPLDEHDIPELDPELQNVSELQTECDGDCNCQYNNDIEKGYSTNQIEGLKYFAGSLVRKDKDLSKVNNDTIHDNDFVESNWISLRNRSGLAFPHKELVKDLKVMEIEFQRHHEDSPGGLSKMNNVTKSLADRLKIMFPKYDLKVLRKFTLGRTMRRMKCIQNSKVRESRRSKTVKINRLYTEK